MNFDDLLKFHKKKLKKNPVVRLVGCHDGLSARLVEEHGFEGVWSSGFAISASHAVPDCSVLTKTEFLERAREMRKATHLPILVDMDTGYGTAPHLRWYVREFDELGVDGVCIEDKKYPKTNSYIPGTQDQEDVHDFQMKIVSAKQATKKPDFWVVARIESLIHNPTEEGLEDAIFRASAYVEAGADAILIHSKSTHGGDIKKFLKTWNKQCPIIIVPTSYPNAFTEEEMGDLGVDIVIYANQLIRAMVYGAKKVLNGMGVVGLPGLEIASMQQMFELQRMPDFKRLESKYNIYGDKNERELDNTGKMRNE